MFPLDVHMEEDENADLPLVSLLKMTTTLSSSEYKGVTCNHGLLLYDTLSNFPCCFYCKK